MKRLISLIVLVQVGSSVVVNPVYVEGILAGDKSQFCNDGGSEIILAGGTAAGTRSIVCSDWSPAQIIVALQEGSLVNVK